MLLTSYCVSSECTVWGGPSLFIWLGECERRCWVTRCHFSHSFRASTWWWKSCVFPLSSPRVLIQHGAARQEKNKRRLPVCSFISPPICFAERNMGARQQNETKRNFHRCRAAGGGAGVKWLLLLDWLFVELFGFHSRDLLFVVYYSWGHEDL